MDSVETTRELMGLVRVRLQPPALEAEYRLSGLASDRRVATGLTIITLVFMVATLPATQALEGTPALLYAVRGIRAIVAVAAIAAMLVVRRAASPDTYDWVVTAWIAVWFTGIVIENALLPATSWSFVAWDVFLTVATYAVLRLSLWRQAALAAILTMGDLTVLWTLRDFGPGADLVDASIAFVAANIVGIFISHELHEWRRRHFVVHRREVAARTALEAARGEVKTLQGIIPICAFCKNVRTDAGDWQRVEAYVRTHSDAVFSHGVCPSCLQEQYPELRDNP